MKLELDVKLNIDIQENGKSKEKITVYLRDYSKEESKKFSKLKADFLKMLKRSKKLVLKTNSVEKKMELYEKAEKYEDAIKMAKVHDKLSEEMEAVTDELEALGGDEFYEERSKESFDVRISGEDKEKLREYAESKGYLFIMQFLEKEKAEVEKKQSDE